MSQPATPTTVAVATGVQVLLDAEKEANRRVQQARQYRVQRLKDARSEAQGEIEALKQQKAEEYAAYERSVLGSLDATFQEYAKETVTKLEQVKQIGEERRDKVVTILLESITKAEPKLHPNAKLKLAHSLQ